jgi:acetyl-CoA synthetase
VRRLEFSELPKTISGKIRRVELRDAETERLGRDGSTAPAGVRGVTEFWEEDFPDLKAVYPGKSD